MTDPLAGRVAWFHEPHPSDPAPAAVTPAQCREAITRRLAASGPLRVGEARTRLEALGFTSRDVQRLLAGSRRHPGLTAAGQLAGARVEVSYRSRRYHVSRAGRDWLEMAPRDFGDRALAQQALFPLPDTCGSTATLPLDPP
jgi:hypothetical protein